MSCPVSHSPVAWTICVHHLICMYTTAAFFAAPVYIYGICPVPDWLDPRPVADEVVWYRCTTSLAFDAIRWHVKAAPTFAPRAFCSPILMSKIQSLVTLLVPEMENDAIKRRNISCAPIIFRYNRTSNQSCACNRNLMETAILYLTTI